MKKIYVLKSYHIDNEETDIICAYTTLVQAQKEMMNNFNQEIADICEDEGLEKPVEFEVNDSERTIFGDIDDYHYGYSAQNAFIDYIVSFSIESCDLVGDENDDKATTKYIVTSEEKHDNSEVEFFFIGQFNHLHDAQAAASQQFIDDMLSINLDENEWKKRKTDDLGSFVYELDKNNYYSYIIEQRTI